MFDKNVYKMTVVCCNYAVASYPPGNRRRAFHWRKYRRSAGDSCIANEPPENAQWNAPIVCCSVNTESQARYRLRIAISAYHICIRRLGWGEGFRRNIAMSFGKEKLEWYGYRTVKSFDKNGFIH